MEQKSTIYSNSDANIKINRDKIWKPLASYSYYLTARIFKMPSTYIFLAATFVAILLIAALPVFFNAQQQILMIPMMTTMLSLFGIILAGTFGIAKSLSIFADFESDGTELLIIAKPITRKQVLLTKFVFLAIIGLIYAALVTLLAFIGVAIIGVDTYNLIVSVSETMVGVFISALISYLVLGLTAIAFGLKFSGKAARALPTVVSSASAIIAMIGVNLITSLIQIPPVNNIEQVNNVLQTETAAKDLKYTVEKEGTSTNELVIITSLSTSIGSNPIGHFVKDSKKYFFVDSLFFSYLDTPGDLSTAVIKQISARSIFSNSESATGDPNIDNYKAIYQYVSEKTLAMLQTKNIQASGATAINFINPVSAFLAIAGTSVFMPQSITNAIPFNTGFSDFVEGGEVTNFMFDERNTYTLPYSFIANESFQVDQAWVVGLVWLGIFAALATFTIIAYFRKDFK